MKYYKKLLGDRVYLSPVRVGDEEIFAKWMNDFYVTDYIGRSDALVTLEGEKAWVNSVIENKNYLFSIIKSEDDKLIGNIELQNVNHTNRTAMIGILIGEDEERNKGFGTEAINLLLDFAFNYLNLNNISLTLVAINDRAKRCYEKVGFKEFGRQRESRFINGKYYDVIYMDILAKEFSNSFIKNKNI